MPTQVFINCSSIPIAVFAQAINYASHLTSHSSYYQAEYIYGGDLLGGLR